MGAHGGVFTPIPRVLHQTWKTRDVPQEWRAYRQSWLEQHPLWEHRLWTDDDNRRLISERHSWFLPTYDAFARDIQRVDAAKYFILYTCGGVYADLDCECVKPVDPLVERGGALVGRTPDGVIDAAFLASPAGHPFWKETFRQMQSPPWIARVLHGVPGFDASHVLFSTGPQMLKRAVRCYVDRSASTQAAAITVCDPATFSSRSWLRRHEPFGDVDTFVRHHYSDSWLWPSESAVVRWFTMRNLHRALALLILLGAAAVLME